MLRLRELWLQSRQKTRGQDRAGIRGDRQVPGELVPDLESSSLVSISRLPGTLLGLLTLTQTDGLNPAGDVGNPPGFGQR